LLHKDPFWGHEEFALPVSQAFLVTLHDETLLGIEKLKAMLWENLEVVNQSNKMKADNKLSLVELISQMISFILQNYFNLTAARHQICLCLHDDFTREKIQRHLI
jgi:hypothetical protein